MRATPARSARGRASRASGPPGRAGPPADDAADRDDRRSATGRGGERLTHAGQGEDRAGRHDRARRRDDDDVGRLDRLLPLGSDAGRLDAPEAHRGPGVPAVDEVLLEVEPAVGRADLGAHLVVGHRQDRGRDAERCRQGACHVGRPLAAPEPLGAHEVGGKVAVAEAEPGVLASRGERLDHGPALAREPPAALLVIEAGQRVGDGVVVRPDLEAVPFEVVARVDDDGQVGPHDGLQPVRQLRAADASGQLDDPRHVSRGAGAPRGRGSGS